MNTVKEEVSALLDLLSGDFNYDNVAKAKAKLKDLVETKEAKTMWFSPISNWESANHHKELYDLKRTHGCLLAGKDRGDCEHYKGTPEAWGLTDREASDEYGRPYDWCEVCWRGEQIKRLRKEVNEHKETIIQHVVQTEEGRTELAASMVEPIRTQLEYN